MFTNQPISLRMYPTAGASLEPSHNPHPGGCAAGPCPEVIPAGGVSRVGNGLCDADLNVPQCQYDGGDCCAMTCVFNPGLQGVRRTRSAAAECLIFRQTTTELGRRAKHAHRVLVSAGAP